MHALTRRAFLLTATTAALVRPAFTVAQGQPTTRFAHGVASGDPDATGVVIWTRVTPRDNAARTLRVRWQVTTDSPSPIVVRAGTTKTSAARDYTVKVDVRGLQPGGRYLYSFAAEGEDSPIGRTRTLASETSHVRVAAVSCSNLPAGFFNAYAAIAARDDIDVVVHLGDYIYEFANGVFGDGTPLGRVPDPEHEATSLEDYRRRYACYRRDPDLQRVHQRHPIVAVWDDHELADNAWAGGPTGWAERRAAAMRAYREWMPVREGGSPFSLYRSFSFGRLATLNLLDTRSLRDGQVNANDLRALEDPRRRLLGAVQERWLTTTLSAAKQRNVVWALIGQQVMFSPFTRPGSTVRNPDSWDGYQAERTRIRALLARTGNAVVLTGDVHSAWAFDVPLDPWNGYRPETGEGSVAVELIVPAVSSEPYFTGDQSRTLGPSIRASLPHLKFLDGEHRGFLILDITPARVQATWYITPDVLRRSPDTRPSATFVVERGSSRLST